jgi:hypothetical protein
MSFKKSLSIGQMGETLYFAASNGTLERLDGRKADFRVMSSDDLVELKTDSYSMSTGNFFIERYSDVNKKSPGGPFQASANGCKYFDYFYVQDLAIFRFNTEELCQWIKEHEAELKPMNIGNTTWTTQGYLVKRELVKHLYEVSHLEISLKKKEEAA